MNLAVHSTPSAMSHRSSTWVRKASLISALFALAGCGEPDAEEDDGAGSGANLILLDEHNYTSTSSLTLPTVETASATDLDICWSDVATDLQCHELAPQTDLDNVALLRFLHLTEEDVEQRLTAGQLAQSEIDGYLEYNTDHASTCTKLSAMSFFGTAIDISEEYIVNTDNTYMLLFAHGTTPGVGARTMIFIKPTTASTNTVVDAQSGCGFLDFTANIAASTPLQVPSAGPWRLDWRDITRDGGGNPVAFEAIDSVLLGYYENKTIADIEAEIFDIELIASALWEIQLTGGRTADLANAQQRGGSGELFTGFDRGPGVWLLALMCSTCQNPAPILLTVLEPT